MSIASKGILEKLPSLEDRWLSEPKAISKGGVRDQNGVRGEECTGTFNLIWMGRDMGASTGADVTKCGWAWLFRIFSVTLLSADFIVAHKLYFNPFTDNGKPSQGGREG